VPRQKLAETMQNPLMVSPLPQRKLRKLLADAPVLNTSSEASGDEAQNPSTQCHWENP